MKESVQIFNSPQFGEIRTAGTPEEPLFCLADVCKALELQTHKVVQRLDNAILSKYPIKDSLGREQIANFLTESGLYDVILDSRKPEARAFRKWITGEVLPSIRRTGGYMLSTSDMTDEEIMARALTIANHCDEGDVTKRDTHTSSGVQSMTFVNESGHY